jgi:hypothetical protein
LRGVSENGLKRLSDLNVGDATATVQDDLNLHRSTYREEQKHSKSALEEESKTGAISSKSISTTIARKAVAPSPSGF